MMHPLEIELRAWLQNWKYADANDLERISVDAKKLGLTNVHLAAEEFLDAISVQELEPVVQRCLAMLDEAAPPKPDYSEPKDQS